MEKGNDKVAGYMVGQAVGPLALVPVTLYDLYQVE